MDRVPNFTYHWLPQDALSRVPTRARTQSPMRETIARRKRVPINPRAAIHYRRGIINNRRRLDSGTPSRYITRDPPIIGHISHSFGVEGAREREKGREKEEAYEWQVCPQLREGKGRENWVHRSHYESLLPAGTLAISLYACNRTDIIPSNK